MAKQQTTEKLDRAMRNGSISQRPAREAAEFRRSFQKHMGALL